MGSSQSHDDCSFSSSDYDSDISYSDVDDESSFTSDGSEAGVANDHAVTEANGEHERNEAIGQNAGNDNCESCVGISDVANTFSLEGLKEYLHNNSNDVKEVLDASPLFEKQSIVNHSKSSHVKRLLAQHELEEEKEYIDLAVQLLELSRNLRHLRFQLVPGRMKERVFWSTVIILLSPDWREGVESEAENSMPEVSEVSERDGDNQSQENGEGGDTNLPEDGENQASSPMCNGTPVVSSTYGQSFEQVMNGYSGSTVMSKLQKQVKEKNWQILKLERKLKEAQDQIRDLQQEKSRNHSSQGSATDDAAPSRRTHTGNWVMTQESRDFLALDKELKDNMRREKKKRLAEVEKQMKFILDSDHLRSSFGEWDCCRQTSYEADGCCSE